MMGKVIAGCGARAKQRRCAYHKLDRKLAAFGAQVAIQLSDIGFHLQNPQFVFAASWSGVSGIG
jgi:hypothetical protein